MSLPKANTCDRHSSTEAFFRGRKLTLNYTNGSPCDEPSNRLSARKLIDHDKDGKDEKDDEDDDDKDDDDHENRKGSPSKTAPRRKSTLISFLCDRESLDSKVHLSFVGTLDECAYFFEARSSAACGGAIAAQQTLGPGGVFGVIALIAAAVYLLGGIAYQRTVMHQRGWRQLPNYTLWAGMFGFISVRHIELGVLETLRSITDEKTRISLLFSHLPAPVFYQGQRAIISCPPVVEVEGMTRRPTG